MPSVEQDIPRANWLNNESASRTTQKKYKNVMPIKHKKPRRAIEQKETKKKTAKAGQEEGTKPSTKN
jgi:hypothetical protein